MFDDCIKVSFHDGDFNLQLHNDDYKNCFIYDYECDNIPYENLTIYAGLKKLKELSQLSDIKYRYVLMIKEEPKGYIPF